MHSAQETLEAKKEIFDIKKQRLDLAQDEFNHLNALAASRSSRKYYLIEEGAFQKGVSFINHHLF